MKLRDLERHLLDNGARMVAEGANHTRWRGRPAHREIDFRLVQHRSTRPVRRRRRRCGAAQQRVGGPVGVQRRPEPLCEVASGDAPQDLAVGVGEARVPGPAPTAPFLEELTAAMAGARAGRTVVIAIVSPPPGAPTA